MINYAQGMSLPQVFSELWHMGVEWPLIQAAVNEESGLFRLYNSVCAEGDEPEVRTNDLTGSGWSASQTSSESLASALRAAADVAEANESARPLDQQTLRVFHNIADDGLNEILVIREGWKS